MGLVYDLNNTISRPQINDLESVHCIKETKRLKAKFSPKKECKKYILKNGGSAILIKKSEFEKACQNKLFLCGPHTTSSTKSKQAFGTINSHVIVYCELSKNIQNELNTLFSLFNF